MIVNNGNFQILLLFVLVIWSLIWKGISLWKASKNNQKYWYIALLIINSVGILDILYLGFFQKKSISN